MYLCWLYDQLHEMEDGWPHPMGSSFYYYSKVVLTNEEWFDLDWLVGGFLAIPVTCPALNRVP